MSPLPPNNPAPVPPAGADGIAAPPQARFLTGSTMRHVTVMSIAGALGLSFLFLIDFLAVLWVSQYDDESMIAAVGYAFTIQFFPASMNIGMMIATIALYARALGGGYVDRARRIATLGILAGLAAQLLVSGLLWTFRDHILTWTGASGATLEMASDFLGISLFGMPLMVVGMTMAGLVRATGDAFRATLVTALAALVALVVDPFNILYLGMGVEGAGLSVVITRSVMCVLGAWFLLGVHNMAARPRWDDLRNYLLPWVAIAGPAVLTQCSTPFGNWVLMRAMAEYGDSATAGLGVVLRLIVLVFGGIFALSGAIGGILGQNYGGGRMDRVAQAYKDALKFCAIYAIIAWGLLALLTEPLVAAFALTDEGATVMRAFCWFVPPALIFTGALFVANAAFNNLGRPLMATVANWLRDGVVTFPLAVGLGVMFGATGVLMGQAAAGVIVGIWGAWLGWRYVRRLRDDAVPVDGDPRAS